MKLVKFITRKYTLLEHWLIAESLLKKNTSIPGIYYTETVDISRKGLVDIHISKEDGERNKQWVIRYAKQDPCFVEDMLKKGLEATENLSKLPFDLLNNIPELEDKKIIKELFKLKQKLFDYSGYLDFTIHLGNSGIKLSKGNIERLSRFHDYRKKTFMNYFKFLKEICEEIAKKKNVKSENLSYLSFSEIIQFLEGKLTPKEVDELQEKRKEHYIAKRVNDKEVIISDGFEEEFKRIKEDILEEDICGEVKGIAINKGVVKGTVKIIRQIDSLSNVPSGKVIVTQMTNPEMTPILKKSLAIVTDEGGMLCHAAHVAREFGVIAVIGTKTATKILKDGDMVEVDAEKGVVRKI